MNAKRCLGMLFGATLAMGGALMACTSSNPIAGDAGNKGGAGGSPILGGSGGAGGTPVSSGSGGIAGAGVQGGRPSTGGGMSTDGGTSVGGHTSMAGGAGAGGVAMGTGGASSGGSRDGGTAGCTACNQGGRTDAGGNTTADAGNPDGLPTVCGDEYFKDWAAGQSPKEVGLKLAKLFDSQAVDTSKHYKTACTWYGALNVAGLLKDPSLKTLISKFEQLQSNFVASTTKNNHVDNSVFGIVPLEIFLQNADMAVRDLGLAVADHQIANINTQKRMAIDDMFMITGLQVQAFRAAPEEKKRKYLDVAADTMVEYLKMQKPDGCFYQREGANAKWGRGNGWFASGMAEMMSALDPSHKHYKTLLDAYKKMMKGLLDYQIKSGPGAGIWNQVIDSTDSKNWPETSGSAMFTYAMTTGVKLCILDAATYGPVARAAWDTLTSPAYLGADGRLKEISDWCYWTSGDALTYYLTVRGTNSRVVGDGHGQAPLLWAAAALLK